MGQKVHPESIRVGYIHDWKSNWFNEKNFADYLHEDTQIREHIIGRLSHAGLSDITIRKNANEVEVNIHTARPGIVIGKSGSEVDQLRRDLHRITNKQVKVNILEIKRPELDARLVAQSIAEQLQNRVAFRRAMKRALTSAMRSGAKGVKVQVSGRLGGAEMARTEGYSDGRVPLHTLRADIDYGFHEAKTTFGRIGVKCWINKGEIMPEGYTGADLTIMDAPAPQAPERGGRDGRDNRGRAGGRGGAGGGSGGPGGRGRGRGPGQGGPGQGGPGQGGAGGPGGRGSGGSGGRGRGGSGGGFGGSGGGFGGSGGGSSRGPRPGGSGGSRTGGQGGQGGSRPGGQGGQGGAGRGPRPGGSGGQSRGPRPAGGGGGAVNGGAGNGGAGDGGSSAPSTGGGN
jgi:small subunit ribosomal protein S3